MTKSSELENFISELEEDEREFLKDYLSKSDLQTLSDSFDKFVKGER